MEWFVRAFLKSSVAWLAVGVSMGVAMALHPVWTVYRPAHLHVTLLGFVAMMIFGVAYHIVPRLAGHPLYGRRLALAHWWIANIGVALFSVGLMLRADASGYAGAVVGIGATLSAAGAYIFAWIVWRTIDGPTRVGAMPVAPAPPAAPTSRRRLMVLDEHTAVEPR
jgi:hypothetical protein